MPQPQVQINENDWLSSHRWDQNIPCPMGKRLSLWQSKLTDLFGCINGKPLLRVVWGQSPTTFQYNRYLGEWTPKYDWGYVSRWVTNPAGIEVEKRTWIGLPRLIIERAAKPRQIETADTVDLSGQVVKAERLYEAVEYQRHPEYGVLVQHVSIKDADGNSLCCVKAAEHGHPCWGLYREIDQQDIDNLKRILAEGDSNTVVEEGRIILIGEQ